MQPITVDEYEFLKKVHQLIDRLADALENKQWNQVTEADLELIAEARRSKLIVELCLLKRSPEFRAG
jgi:hypothetical protein